VTASISIIIPFRDKHATLDDTLASIAIQEVDVEAIIVDDGSSESPQTIVDAWASRIPGGVQLVTRRHRGASAARNHGLAVATGDKILFLDADDLLAANCLARFAAALDDEQADAALGSLAELSTRDGSYRIGRMRRAVLPDFPADWLADDHVFGQTVLFRRSVLDAIGPWDETLARWQDTNHVLRLLLRSPRLAIVPGAVTLWRRDHHTISSRASWAALASAFTNVELVIDHLAKQGTLDTHREAIAGYGAEQANLAFATECLRRMRAIDPRDPLPPLEFRERMRVTGELARLGVHRLRDRLRRETWFVVANRDALLTAFETALPPTASEPRTRPAPNRPASTT